MEIAVVDYMTSNAQERFVQSVERTGFCVLKNHPIDVDLINDSFAKWHAFFSQPEEKKLEYVFKRDFEEVQDGFFPTAVSETAKGVALKDLKEFFHYYPVANRLPDCIGASTPQLRKELLQLGKTLLGWLEEALPQAIRQQLSMPLPQMADEHKQTLLRILHYPPLPKKFPEGSVRGAAHEDINLITLLVAPSAPGLQAKDKEGNWHEVPCDKNCIVVNMGDMLQECTQNYFPATTHQVVNLEGGGGKNSRYSMPLFLHPRREVRLSSRYTAEQYLNERLRELGLL